jgi:gas vesicle protein
VWDYDRSWSIDYFKDQGDDLVIDDCHAEIAKLKKNLRTVKEMREKEVCGCLSVNAKKLKAVLIPATQEKIKAMSKFTSDTERDFKQLVYELSNEKKKFEEEVVAQLPAMFDKVVDRTECGAGPEEDKGRESFLAWERTSGEALKLVEVLAKAKDTVEDFNAREKRFKTPELSAYPALAATTEKLEPYERVWGMIRTYKTHQREWLSGSLLQLDAPAAETEVMELYKKSAKVAKLLEHTHPALARCAQQLREDTAGFRGNLPVMVALATPALQQPHAHQHWENLSEVLDHTLE